MTAPTCKVTCGDTPGGGGGGGAAAFLGAKLGKTADQEIQNDTDTLLTWEVAVIDVGGYADLALEAIVIPTGLGGLYHIGVAVQWNDHEQVGSAFERTNLIVNGTEFIALYSGDTESSQTNAGSTITRLSDGDVLQARVLQDSGAAVDVAGAAAFPEVTSLWAYRIGD